MTRPPLNMYEKVTAYAKFCKLRKVLEEARNTKGASIGKQEAIVYARQMYTKHLQWRNKE